MNIAWRFYVGEDELWRWEQLSEDHGVVARSRMSYDGYEPCLAAARVVGYVFEKAPQKRPYTPSLYDRVPAPLPSDG